MYRVALLALVTLTMLPNSSAADTVFFRGGAGQIGQVTGTVVTNTNEQVEVLQHDGTRLTIPRSQVFQVTFDQTGTPSPDQHQAAPRPSYLQPTAAPNNASSRHTYREPSHAFLWSLLVPGGGQFYNGDFASGLLCLGGAVVGASMILSADPLSPSYYESVGTGQTILFAASLSSLLEAPFGAISYNRKHGLAAGVGVSEHGPQLAIAVQF
jgi:hypothetical protein